MRKRQTLIDWQRLALNLRSEKTLSIWATELGCDSMTLQRLARRDVDEPRFELGLKLLNVHLDLFPDQHHDLLKAQIESETLSTGFYQAVTNKDARL